MQIFSFYFFCFLGDEQLAQDFFDLAIKVEKIVHDLGYPGCDSPEHSDEPLEARRVSVITSTSEALNQELATVYISSLKDMQFESCDIDGKLSVVSSQYCKINVKFLVLKLFEI